MIPLPGEGRDGRVGVPEAGLWMCSLDAPPPDADPGAGFQYGAMQMSLSVEE